jgi:serine/threonine protein kinase
MKKFKIIKNLIGGKCETLTINHQIPGGASFMTVYSGFCIDNKVIIKMCSKKESLITQILQNDENLYIVKLFDIFDHCKLKSFDTTNIISSQKNTDNYIIIEELQPLKLYLDYTYKSFLSYPYIMIEHNLKFNKKNIEIIHIYITKDLINILIKCASIIQYLHSKKIFYGDFKQENMGIDLDGNFKIFDFGESILIEDSYKLIGQYDQHPLQNDILALGKLFINIITNRNVFAPGRHYTSHRFSLNEEDFEILFKNLIINDHILTDFLKRMFNIKMKEYDNTILDLLLRYLKSLVD